MRQSRRWKRLWRRSVTRSHKRISKGPSRSCWNGTTSALQPEEITSKGCRVSCVCYQLKCPYEKSLETYLMPFVQPREEEKRTNKYGLRLLALSVREKFWHFSGILWLSRACTRMRFSHTYQERWLILSRWLTWLLGPQVPTPRFNSSLSLTVVFFWLWLTPICSALGPCFSSSSSCLVGNLACKPFVWVSRQNRQRNPLTGARPNPLNECLPKCHIRNHTNGLVSLFHSHNMAMCETYIESS